ncbi:MAG: hypothetical protein KF842_15680 [Caulobacter sp.]|nr:hypothetical protein [Caulobacter sp.]
MLAAIMVFVGVIPSALVSVISFRMNRKALWLALPWLLSLVATLGIRAMLHVIGLTEWGYPGGFFLGLSAVVGGWIAAGITLLALAIAGPDSPGNGTLWKRASGRERL